METFNLFLTKFTDETIAISSFSMLFLLGIIIVYWIFNRRKYHKLSHQIPASVVKNYLDSIIQNSTSLKSSLFRGGGLDLGDGIPSVVPVSSLSSGMGMNTGVSSEELNQKNAELANLRNQLSAKDQIIIDLEKQLAEVANGGDTNPEELSATKAELSKAQEELKQANAKNKELEEKLASAASTATSDDSSSEEMMQVMKDRDELKDRLAEYEIIEEDLANLKKLQVENGELKEEIARLKAGGATSTTTPKPADTPSPEPKAEPAATPEPVAAAEEKPAGDSESSAEQKTADELLSEFEKMLG